MKATRVKSMADLRESEICYWKDEQTGTWFIYLPGCGAGGLGNHRIQEHEDGTITATPSILMSGHNGTKGHGYLTRGDWAESPDSTRVRSSAERRSEKMAAKADLHVGDKVEGLRSFDKQHRVQGRIWQILNGPYIDVQLENGTIESMHVDDVHVIEARKPADPKIIEAVEYVRSCGYSQAAAESIVAEHTADEILQSKAEEAEAIREAEEEEKAAKAEAENGTGEGTTGEESKADAA